MGHYRLGFQLRLRAFCPSRAGVRCHALDFSFTGIWSFIYLFMYFIVCVLVKLLFLLCSVDKFFVLHL